MMCVSPAHGGGVSGELVEGEGVGGGEGEGGGWRRGWK